MRSNGLMHLCTGSLAAPRKELLRRASSSVIASLVHREAQADGVGDSWWGPEVAAATMSMYESEVPKGEPDMPPPSAVTVEPGAPPPADAVPDYSAPAEGMTSSGWWDSMASLTLCGKKVTNEQAKAIFTALMAAIVLLVVVVVMMAAGGGGDASDAGAPVSGGPSVAQNWNGGGGGDTWQVQNTKGTSDWVRLSGKNAVCSEGGCTGRIEVRVTDRVSA